MERAEALTSHLRCSLRLCGHGLNHHDRALRTRDNLGSKLQKVRERGIHHMQVRLSNDSNGLRVGQVTLTTCVVCALSLVWHPVSADDNRADLPSIVRVWDRQPPGSESWTQTEITYTVASDDPHAYSVASDDPHGGNSHYEAMVRDVTVPTMTAYWPHAANQKKTAMIICPGGGFRFLSWQTEGTDLAKWLAARGVAVFVLKYRLVPTTADPQQFNQQLTDFWREFSEAVSSGKRPRSLEEMLPDTASKQVRALVSMDARQAVKVLRAHAAEWGIAADRIGMLGFSAGGFLVTDVMLADDPTARLDFAALIYGGELGGNRVPARAPPLFITVAQDDLWMSGPVLELFSRWQAVGKSVELHYFHQGGHGFGTDRQNLPVDHWTVLLARWLTSQKPGNK
jgi:acetyl esterase/lipase